MHRLTGNSSTRSALPRYVTKSTPLIRYALFPLCLALSTGASAQPDWLQVTWENDLFAGEDDGYTNGAAVSWGYRGLSDFDQERLPGWLAFLAQRSYLADSGTQRAVSYSIGQAMFTPEDIEVRTPLPTDRPYAGLLLWSTSIYAYDERVSDRLSLSLGAVGPIAGAKPAQRFIHSVTGGSNPRGWSNQLRNEPVFAVGAQRLWRLGAATVGGLELDSVAGAYAGAGNLLSNADAGITFRLGSRLADTWSAVSLIPSRTLNTFALEKRSSWQLYLSMTGRYVFNDITLDGNTFRDSPSVPLKHRLALGSLGIAVNRGRWGATLSYQLGTDQYEGQEIVNRFGSLAVTHFF